MFLLSRIDNCYLIKIKLCQMISTTCMLMLFYLLICSTSVLPLYHADSRGSLIGLARFTPASPLTGMNEVSPSLNPACLRNCPSFFTTSSYLSCCQPTVSILFTATMSWDTPGRGQHSFINWHQNLCQLFCKFVNNIRNNFLCFFQALISTEAGWTCQKPRASLFILIDLVT